MTLEERIERLESLYEKVYHENELLSMYIPRLTNILTKYFGESGKHRYAIMRDFEFTRDVVRMIDTDMQDHFKSHRKQRKKDRL